MYTPSQRSIARRVMYVLPQDAREAVIEFIASASGEELRELYTVPGPTLTAPLASLVTAPYQSEEKAFDTLRGASCAVQADFGSTSWDVKTLVDAFVNATGMPPAGLENALNADARLGAKSDSDFLLKLALAVPAAGAIGKLMKSTRLGWVATIGSLLLSKVASSSSSAVATTLSRFQALGEAMDDLEGVNVLAAYQLAHQPNQGQSPSQWTERLKQPATEAPTILFGAATLLGSGLVPSAITNIGKRAVGALPAGVKGLLPAGDPDLNDDGPAEAGDPDVELGRFLVTANSANVENGSLGRLIQTLGPQLKPLLASTVPGGPLLMAAADGATKQKRKRPQPHHVERVVHAARSGAVMDANGNVDPARLAELLSALEKEREREEAETAS